MPEPFGVSTIGQIALTVRDLDRAVAFYRDRPEVVPVVLLLLRAGLG